MAYDAILDAEIAVGKPTKKELWDKTQGNLDDHETRINSVETGAAVVNIFQEIFAGLNNLDAEVGNTDNVAAFRVNQSLTITEARITLITSSASGTCTVDVQKGAIGSTSSIFSAKPSFTGTSAGTTATGSISDNSLSPGDYLVVNFDSIQSYQGRVLLSVIGEVS